MERRRFVVIGLGSFGHNVAKSLYEMGHDVLGIDRNKSEVEAISPFCSRAEVADAADKDELIRAGAGAAEVGIVGLGSRIDASILATLFLREMGVKEIVAKALSQDHGRILTRIGATEVIQPEQDMAVQLAQSLAQPDILERIPFLEEYALIELRAPKALEGKTLSEAKLRRAHMLSVALIRRRRGNEEISVPARADEKMQHGDVLVVLAKMEDVEAFRKAYPE